MVFAAYTSTTGTEFWKSNGTEAGTVLIKDLIPGEAGIYPTFYESKNGKVYFTLYNDTTKSADVYYTNGTQTGTKRIATNAGSLYEIEVADNGIVFYAYYDYNTSPTIQLWRTDSTGNSFRLSLNVTNINGDEIGVAGNICYFGDGMNGKLWKSDGTLTGTKLVSSTVSSASWYTPFEQ